MLMVTGATGFVGRTLTDMMASRVIPFRAIGRSSRPGLFNVGSINGSTDWYEALKGVTTVVHLAAKNENVVSPDNQDSDFHGVNVDGTKNLACQAIAAGVRRIVFLSTVKVNGEKSPPGKPFSIRDDPNPQTAYAISKHRAEETLKALCEAGGIELIIIRSPLVYGYGSTGSFDALVKIVRRGIPLPLGSVRNRRSMIHVENLSDLILACCEEDVGSATIMASEKFTVSTGELAKMIGVALDRKVNLLPVPVAALRLAGLITGKSDITDRLTESLEVNHNELEEMVKWLPKVEPIDALKISV